MGGHNLAEKFDLSFIEENPVLQDSISKVLGPDYNILLKKFIVAIPLEYIPDWIKKDTMDISSTNLGPYIKSEYADMTYFVGVDFHQDIIDHKDRLADFITLYVYLDDVDENMSPLVIAPHSHIFGATTFPHNVVLNDGKKTKIKGSKKNTTNNQMELLAPIQALKKIPKGSKVQIFTDSKYVKSGITEWIHNWKKNGWKTANKQKVKNKELWTELDLLTNEFEIKWSWVKAHSTDKLNNEVDLIAREAAN